MPSKKYTTPVKELSVLHIFNKGINYQTVFHTDEDKKWFLQRFKHYLDPYASVISYSVLDNHYHFLVKVKKRIDVPSDFSRQFGNLALSYTHYYNRKYGHSGPVFHRCFKRLEVPDETLLLLLFWYIHKNPVVHRKASDFKDYRYSSIGAYMGNQDILTEVSAGFMECSLLMNSLQDNSIEHDELMLGKLAME